MHKDPCGSPFLRPSAAYIYQPIALVRACARAHFNNVNIMSDLDVDKGPALLIILWALTSGAGLFVVCRLLVRLRILKKAGWDDFLITVSIVRLHLLELWKCTDGTAPWLCLCCRRDRRRTPRLRKTHDRARSPANGPGNHVHSSRILSRPTIHRRPKTGCGRSASPHDEPECATEVHPLGNSDGQWIVADGVCVDPLCPVSAVAVVVVSVDSGE